MKVIKRTFLTAAVTLFAAVLCLFVTGIVLAACSDKVTLRFVTNGGTELDSVEGAVGTAYRVPQDPEKEGYFFDGWYLQSDFSGERQSLPDKMPDKSTTYYAKYVPYAYLTLDAAGGTLSALEHKIKPDTLLCDYLRDFVPEKEGLIFGGWQKDGTLLSSNARMPEGSLTLTAKYKAAYEVNVYVQDPDSPENFIKNETWSKAGADWEGTTLKAQLPKDEHLFLDPERETADQKILSAGENVLDFYYLREAASIDFSVRMKNGTVETKKEETLFGAHVPLWEGPKADAGYLLYGWAENEGESAKFVPLETFTVGQKETNLFGTWAKKYEDPKRGGYFAVEELEMGGKHGARYVAMDGAYEAGVFDETNGVFSAKECGGRLDGRGYFLADDSGSYQGYDLAENKTSAERFGTLILDFLKGTAVFSLNNEKIEGSYDFLWDDSAGRYLGVYRFASSSGEGFDFALSETEMTFRREGKEKGTLALFEGGKRSEFEALTLDGFGGAILKDRGEEIEGAYVGAGKENEWLFSSKDRAFRFLAGTRNFALNGANIASERGYLIYRDDLAGVFTGAGTLTLDGYGLLGEYIDKNGQKKVENFSREGAIVCFEESGLCFTLKGNAFFVTGKEAGSYLGERGTLLLDGCGQASLQDGEKTLTGEYSRGAENEFSLRIFQGEELKLKLFEDTYRIFNSQIFGNFEGRYSERLTLDGFGSGVYTTAEEMKLPVSVEYFGEGFLELTSPNWNMPHYFKLLAGNKMKQPSDFFVGVYRVMGEDGKEKALLVLDEGKTARRYENGSFVSGSYLEVSFGTVKCFFGGNETGYLLSEKNGKAVAVEYKGAGSYQGGAGTLSLDGYERAVYSSASKKIEGNYLFFSGAVELYTESGLWRFQLNGGSIESASYFEGFEGERGKLYLEQNGTRALIKGEKNETGSYQTVENGGKNYLVYSGEESFSFRCKGNTFRDYDETKETVLRSAEGGTLSLDGCGGAVFAYSGIRAEGEVSFGDDGLILFRSQNLESFSGVRAFKVLSNGTLALLGAEYGSYRRGEETLFLDGEGGALFEGVQGSYSRRSETAEFVFSGGGISFRFRLQNNAFERYEEALERLSGSYETALGRLEIDGFCAKIVSDNNVQPLCVFLIREDIIIFECSGALWGVQVGESTEVSRAEIVFFRGGNE